MRHQEDSDLGEVAFLINKSQHVQRFVGEDIQGALVVFVVNFCPDNVFTGVLVLLQLENMSDKELLQLLVGKVDAELLKAATKTTLQEERWMNLCVKTAATELRCPENCCKPVFVEVLKAKDVQEADRLSNLFGVLRKIVDGSVDFAHHPNEESPINSLDK